MKFKLCTKCNFRKKIDSFWKSNQSADGLRSNCILCVKKYHGILRIKNLEHNLSYYKNYRDKTRRLALLTISKNLECKKCGFNDLRALQIDHINGGGNKDRKKFNVHQFNLFVMSNPELFQILCANCNNIKRNEKKEYKKKKD